MPLEERKYLYDIQQAIDLIDATIDDRIVWGVVERKLPQLRKEVRELLQAVPD
ncbi:MAG: hypothetical protein HYU76_13595 [Betaproteobacteria bacterium]|nr:hypothetical protein [Betaproteobacteria bacterium]